MRFILFSPACFDERGADYARCAGEMPLHFIHMMKAL